MSPEENKALPADFKYFPSVAELRDPALRAAVFDFSVSPEHLAVLEAEVLPQRPDFRISLVDSDGGRDLGFLKAVPHLAHLSVRAEEELYQVDALASLIKLRTLGLCVPSLKCLDSVPETLTSLVLFQSGDRKHDLRRLKRFSRLEQLDIQCPTHYGEVIGTLTKLQDLRLHGARINDLAPLASLQRLKRLNLASARVTDLSPLTHCLALESVVLRWLPRVTSLEPLIALPRLSELIVEVLSGLRELPSLAESRALKRLFFEGKNGISDYSQVATAPVLEEFGVGAARRFAPSDFDFMIGHPSLKKIGVYFGSEKKNCAFAARFAGTRIEVGKFDW